MDFEPIFRSQSHVQTVFVNVRCRIYATAHNQQPTANSPQPTANSPQPTAYSQQPTAYSPQPTAHSPQTTAHSQQHTANSPSPQPTTRSQQPTANSQQPTPNSQASNQAAVFGSLGLGWAGGVLRVAHRILRRKRMQHLAKNFLLFPQKMFKF